MVKSIVAFYESQEKNGHNFRFFINLRRKLSSENFCRKRHLCTRQDGRWRVHGDAVLVGDPKRGGTPESMSSIYGTTDQPNWWKRLQRVTLYQEPKGETDLGLDEGTLPATGQAHVIHVELVGNGKPPEPVSSPSLSPLASLTQVMDEAWEAGRLTPEQIEQAIWQFRKDHPYGR